jgi:hypothetical protein
MAEMRASIGRLLNDVSGDKGDVERLRSILVACGEWEQAAFDAGALDIDTLTALRDLTDCAADAFCLAWRCNSRLAALTVGRPDLTPWIDAVRAQLAAVSGVDIPLRVKTPEGFAFYSLYPEQYAAAAEAWSRDNAGLTAATRAGVIGLRSIGTTLSAVVTAILRLNGWRVTRFTVRPHGHPFDRKVTLTERDLVGFTPSTLSLIVDEGPGLSGSSMAAAAQALADAGVERRRISFLPGHDNGPGAHASENVRAWWAEAPRYFVPNSEIRWDGYTLIERLAAKTIDLLDPGCSMRDLLIEDLAGGMWRTVAYDDPALWPPSDGLFEASGYRIQMPDGRAVLWRFKGVAVGRDGSTMAEAAFEQVRRRAEAGWTLAPGAVDLGFVATPWIDGDRYSSPWHHEDHSADIDVFDTIGRYISKVAGAPMPAEERACAFDRISEMLVVNVTEACGADARDGVRACIDNVREQCLTADSRTYGDGRLAPHEWVLSRSGAVLKPDAACHEVDHTIIGRQAVAWDLACAIVEWGVDTRARQRLLDAYIEAGGEEIPSDILEFYCLCYAAFRLGVVEQVRGAIGDDSAERARLTVAGDFYRREIDRRLRATRRKAA